MLQGTPGLFKTQLARPRATASSSLRPGLPRSLEASKVRSAEESRAGVSAVHPGLQNLPVEHLTPMLRDTELNCAANYTAPGQPHRVL